LLHVGVDELDAPQLQEEGERVNVVGVSMFRRRMIEVLANGWGRELNGVGDGCGRYEKKVVVSGCDEFCFMDYGTLDAGKCGGKHWE
jgi:hypothetical protein